MRLKIFLLVCLLAEVYSYHCKPKPFTGVKRSKRIVGGRNAHPGDFPYLVSIHKRIIKKGEQIDIHLCGGAIIDARWILTAAHCHTYETIVIKAGKHDISKQENHEQIVLVKKFILSKAYDSKRKHNDIALILLQTPLTLNEHVAKIDLPARNSEPTGHGVLAGWGSVSPQPGSPMSEILQAVTLFIVDRHTCDHEAKKIDHNNKVINSQICVKGVPRGAGGCTGDSGGPLVMSKAGGRKEVVGIFSWSYLPCGLCPAPDVLTRVSAYILWIESVMAKHKDE